MTQRSTAPRGPYRVGVKRRAEIIRAASTLIARRGYASASLRLIGEEVGLTTAGLLRHFDSKEDLLIAVLEDWVERTTALQRNPAARGIAYFLFFPDLMKYHMVHPGLIELFLTMCAESTDPDHPARAWVHARYERIVAEAFEHLRYARRHREIRAIPDRQLALEVRGLFAVMDGLELQWLSNPGLDLATAFQHMFNATLTRWGYTGDLPKPARLEPSG